MAQATYTKSDHLNFLRKRLEGIGSKSYKEMISEEIEIISGITEVEFTDYINKMQEVFSNDQ